MTVCYGHPAGSSADFLKYLKTKGDDVHSFAVFCRRQQQQQQQQHRFLTPTPRLQPEQPTIEINLPKNVRQSSPPPPAETIGEKRTCCSSEDESDNVCGGCGGVGLAAVANGAQQRRGLDLVARFPNLKQLCKRDVDEVVVAIVVVADLKLVLRNGLINTVPRRVNGLASHTPLFRVRIEYERQTRQKSDAFLCQCAMLLVLLCLRASSSCVMSSSSSRLPQSVHKCRHIGSMLTGFFFSCFLM